MYVNLKMILINSLGYKITFIKGTKTYPKIPQQHFQEGSEIWSSAKNGLVRYKGL